MRDYVGIMERVAGGLPRGAAMEAVVDALWEAFNHTAEPGGISWVGFYVVNESKRDELLLACRRDKPACSPIGMHGACGRSFVSGRSLVVRDVKSLGANYIACDPRDRSEVVVPCVDDRGVWGVLDVDSFAIGAFDERDARAMSRVLVRSGLLVGEVDVDVV